jgi:DNA modification methylase
MRRVYRTANYKIYRADALTWLPKQRANSFHAVVTDPPFSSVGYSSKELTKRRNGRGGIWRLPSEQALARHPSLKPQSLMRWLVRASLPLATGTVLDPFMGSGATIAAAKAVGLKSVGVESDYKYFSMARWAIPKLADLACAEPK